MLVEKEKLLRALKVMKKVILDSKYQPIYDNAIFNKDGCIRMTSGKEDFEELDLQIRISGGLNDFGDDPFLLPVKTLAGLLSVSEKKKKGRISLVDFEPTEDKLKVVIGLDGINTKMNVTHVEDYPVAPMIIPTKGELFSVADVSKFVEAIKFTRKAICDDIARESLRHMYVAWNEAESEVTVCCTDGHRLAQVPVYMTNKDISAEEIRFTMSDKFIDLLLTSIAVAGKKATVDIFQREREKSKAKKSDAYKFDRVYARIISDDIEIEIVGNVTEYAFPDVSRVISNKGNCETVLKISDVPKFLSVLKRANKLSHADFSGIIFGLEEDKLKLEVRNPDLGDSETELDVEVIRQCNRSNVGNDLVKSRVMLNPKYVLDAIVADGSSFEMAFMENGMDLTPIVFHNDEAYGFLGLVMPMRIDAGKEKE